MKTQNFCYAGLLLCILLGSIALPATAQSNGMWRTNGNNNAGNSQFVGTTDNSALIFKTDNAERLRIQPSGGLKVNSLAGTQQSVVGVKPDGSLFRLDAPGTDTGFTCATRLYSAQGNWLTPNCFIGSVNSAPFRIFSNNAERIRVTEYGTVGIGTDAPQTPLHFYSTSSAELRVQGSTPATQPQVSLSMGTGQTAVKLADVRAGINTTSFIPEVFVEVNDAAGQYSMKKVLRIDRAKAELMTRLGVGMVVPANDYMGVNGSLKLVETNNPANFIRMGHDGTNAFIEHATPNANGNNPSRLFINQGGGRTDFGGDVILVRNLGIGSTNFFDSGNNKDYRLSVDGRIRCTEVKVYSGWADHVFAPDYKLMPLRDVEDYIAANGHLPGMPSAAEVACDGVDVGATQALLLEKIEELTLHLIRLEKENAALQTKFDANAVKMKVILKYGLLLAMSWLPMIGAAQLKDSSKTSIQVGILRNTVDPFTEGTVSVERSIWKRSSVLASFGINPITRKGGIHPVWRFYWQASLEARYYYALRRRYLMSGFYAGLYACYDNKATYYNGTWNPAIHEYFASIGPLIGYQHAFGSHIRVGWGFTTVFYPQQHTDFYNQSGQMVGSTVWPANYTFYTFLRIGITL